MVATWGRHGFTARISSWCVISSQAVFATKTKSGLQVKARLDKRKYPLGTVVPDERMDALHLKRHQFHGELNYTVAPE